MIDSRIFIGLIAVFVTLAGMAYIGINERDRMAEFEAAQHARSIQTGAILFESHCASCHGNQGQGIPSRAPTLNSKEFFETRTKDVGYQGTLESYVQLTVASGRPVKTSNDYSEVMPTWSSDYGGPLRPDQVDNLVDFVMNWEKTATGESTISAPVVADDPVSRGQQVFNASGCAGCHTVDGVSTGAVGPNLTTVYADRGEDYIVESILDPEAVISEGFSGGTMPPIFADTLSEQQIDDVVAFLKDASEK